MKNRSLEASQKRMTIITYTALIIGALIMIFPFVWMILTSLKTVPESMKVPPTIFPEEVVIGNFGDAMKSLPSQIFIIPQYQMVAKMGLANTIFALVFPGIVSAFGVFFLRQTYMGIPKEIGEAAYLDGCNQWQTFYKVMFPLTGTSVAALTIFTAVFAYSDLMWPLVVNSDLNMMTLSSGLATLRGQFTTNFPVLMAGSLLAMLPMVVLYLIFQRQFIEGIASTGGK